MRTIETLTTRQLATGIANAEARDDAATADSQVAQHTIVAADGHVEEVKTRLDAIVPQVLHQGDAQALRSGQAATVQAEYLRRRDAGHYES